MNPASVKSRVSHSTTPDQTRNPARVVTNDGTPSLVMISAWSSPIAVTEHESGENGRPPRPTRIVGTLEQHQHGAAGRGDERHRQVDGDDLAVGDEQDEDDADGEKGDRCHLQEHVREVPRGEELVLERSEHEHDDDQADDDGQRAELAGLDRLPALPEVLA